MQKEPRPVFVSLFPVDSFFCLGPKASIGIKLILSLLREIKKIICPPSSRGSVRGAWYRDRVMVMDRDRVWNRNRVMDRDRVMDREHMV